MKNLCRKCAPNASPRPHFFLGKQPKKGQCMQEILLKIRYFERGLSKTFKKVNFIFSFQPCPF